MPSFFEKLKRGMGIEEPFEERVEKKEEKPKRKRSPRKMEVETEPVEAEPFEPTTSEIEGPRQVKPISPKEEIKAEKAERVELSSKNFALKNLGGQEGQLSVDVYQTNGELIIQTAIAGIKNEDIDITIEEDQVLIKGTREKPAEEEEINYFYQECYWGPFSRQIILPVETDPSKAKASMKEGVLTIRIPKIERRKKRKIEVRG